MALRREQIQEAAAVQRAAAHDQSEHVRVVAGPGTGKSATIEERVCWLLSRGVQPDGIVGISFTGAASDDLRKRITSACERAELEGGASVAVSTLHSFALRILRRAGALAQYPADPTVLQPWELRNIFEEEFGEQCGIRSVPRREEIRRDHEAFWCTGDFDPESMVPPDPPISDEERLRFRSFHGPTTQLYSCVLPGEVVAKCVEMMDAGTLDPVELLGMTDLIVDEFQDLNPMDLRFVHGLAERGVRVFVAGDDDQSLYAFRFATPEGIERFPVERPGTGDHTLGECFRCTPAVLDAAQSLMRAFPAPDRIDKNLRSLWGDVRAGRGRVLAVAQRAGRGAGHRGVVSPANRCWDGAPRAHDPDVLDVLAGAAHPGGADEY
jgi:DNA helicase II / ATP-dependent DNA helicase PcrA